MSDPRPARPEEVPEILDLLGRYDVSPGYFHPWYLEDPEYNVEDSWIVRADGGLVAHLRVFPRRLRLAGGAEISVAGVGNVITHPEHRGRGHAARLLTSSLREATRQEYAYSLLWTHVPRVYEPHGYGLTSQLLLELDPATVSSRREPARYLLMPFHEDDLSAVSLHYAQANARRAGTTVRNELYWRGLLARTPADAVWLLARTEDGSLAGHIRANVGPTGEVTVEELGVTPGHRGAARALLSAVVRPPSPLKMLAPPSYEDLLRGQIRAKTREAGLMGRPLHLGALARAVDGLVASRTDGELAGPYRVHLKGGPDSEEDLLIAQSGATVVPRESSTPEVSLDASQLTTLLFAGDALAEKALSAGPADGATALADPVLPFDDPVLWATDAF